MSAAALSKNLNKEHEDVIKKTGELQQLTATLETKVIERTRELESAKNKIEEQVVNMKNFFINLAHETKTPLTLITNYFHDYIKRKGSDKSLEIIKSNLDKMKRDIVNFFDLEKLMSGKVFYNNDQAVDFSKLLLEKTMLYSQILKTDSVKIKTDIGDSLLINIDPYAIDRIANNLIDNAIRYTQSGTIEIILKETAGKIYFTVKDEGIGIPEDEINHIFEPYYQLSREKNNYQGIGLGLSIVKKIVDLVNGEIIVESRLDKGSSFTIVFKKIKHIANHTDEFEMSKPAALSDVRIKEDHFIEGRCNIMLIEDNIHLLNFIYDYFSENYNIFFATNGKEALEKLKTIPVPDIIITDIMMPEMNGYEFCDKLNEDENFKNIPFLFLTAKALESERIRGLKMGASDYITKPFLIDELIIKINTMMSEKKKNYMEKKQIMDQAKKFVADEFEKRVNDQNASSNDLFEDKCRKYEINRREKEIIKLVLEGKQNKEIAEVYSIGEDAVKKNISKIYKKLSVSNRIELINLFINR
jgi:DNA-binding NarL/FixJ family response regulator/nitrogen-specific signal transduction histidine kinase